MRNRVRLFKNNGGVNKPAAKALTNKLQIDLPQDVNGPEDRAYFLAFLEIISPNGNFLGFTTTIFDMPHPASNIMVSPACSVSLFGTWRTLMLSTVATLYILH